VPLLLFSAQPVGAGVSLQAVSRLSQQYVDLHRALSARSAVDQQAAVERLIAAALDANGLTAADVSAAGEVERLDEQAWLVQEQVERGSATQEQYEAAFRRARAASAVQSLAGPQVAHATTVDAESALHHRHLAAGVPRAPTGAPGRAHAGCAPRAGGGPRRPRCHPRRGRVVRRASRSASRRPAGGRTRVKPGAGQPRQWRWVRPRGQRMRRVDQQVVARPEPHPGFTRPDSCSGTRCPSSSRSDRGNRDLIGPHALTGSCAVPRRSPYRHLRATPRSDQRGKLLVRCLALGRSCGVLDRSPLLASVGDRRSTHSPFWKVLL